MCKLHLLSITGVFVCWSRLNVWCVCRKFDCSITWGQRVQEFALSMRNVQYDRPYGPMFHETCRINDVIEVAIQDCFANHPPSRDVVARCFLAVGGIVM